MLPAKSTNTTRKRNANPASAAVGVKVGASPTGIQPIWGMSASQVRNTGGTKASNPSASVIESMKGCRPLGPSSNGATTVSGTPTMGAAGVKLIVPTAGLFGTPPPTSCTVASANCRFSMLRRVSTPSQRVMSALPPPPPPAPPPAPPRPPPPPPRQRASETVMLPSALLTSMYAIAGPSKTAVSTSGTPLAGASAVRISRTATMLPGSTRPANTACCKVIPAVPEPNEPPATAVCSKMSVVPISVVGSVGSVRTLRRTLR